MPASKSTRRSPPMQQSPAAAGIFPDRPWPADWALQQFAVARSAASVLAQGFDTMRRIQDQAVQASVQRRMAVAPTVKRTQQPKDAIALQAGLFHQDLQDAARCWSDLAAAALETNAGLLACAMQMVKTEDAFGAVAPLVHA